MSIPVSVVIPTCNRPDGLRRTLDSLAAQSCDPGLFEVLVVDDGSTSDPKAKLRPGYPFRFRMVRQENAGATQARRYGAALSRGSILVFIDDDVTLTPLALAALTEACREGGVIALGDVVDRVPEMRTGFARRAAAETGAFLRPGSNQEVDFTGCNTQLLAVRREDYERLGGIQDPTGGWPNWDDVDFGYRAHQAGLRLIKCGGAGAFHWDQSLTTLRSSYRRWYRAAHAAAKLFETHPGIWRHLPMFEDKVRVSWREDPWLLIARKLIRPLSSAMAVLWSLEHMTYFLDSFSAPSSIISRLERWVIGGYIFRGLRDGRLAGGR